MFLKSIRSKADADEWVRGCIHGSLGRDIQEDGERYLAGFIAGQARRIDRQIRHVRLTLKALKAEQELQAEIAKQVEVA